MAKKAVVPGVGAEKGLGTAASRRFAKEGYHVLVAGRIAAKVEKVADSIRAANGSRSLSHRAITPSSAAPWTHEIDLRSSVKPF